VGLWLYSPDHEDWRFVLASRRLDMAEPSGAYGLVHDALEAAGITLEKTPPLLILDVQSFRSRSAQDLRQDREFEGMRLGNQLIGDRFVEDALVCRIR